MFLLMTLLIDFWMLLSRKQKISRLLLNKVIIVPTNKDKLCRQFIRLNLKIRSINHPAELKNILKMPKVQLSKPITSKKTFKKITYLPNTWFKRIYNLKIKNLWTLLNSHKSNLTFLKSFKLINSLKPLVQSYILCQRIPRFIPVQN